MRHYIVLLAALALGCTKIEMESPATVSEGSVQNKTPLISRITYAFGTDTITDLRFNYQNGRLLRITGRDGYGTRFEYDPVLRKVNAKTDYSPVTTDFYFNEKNQLVRKMVGPIGGEYQQTIFTYVGDRLVMDSAVLGVDEPDRTVQYHYYDYQGNRLEAIRSFFRYYRNDVVTGELSYDTIRFSWKNPFELGISYDYGFVDILRFSTSIKDPMYHNVLIPLDMVRPSSYSRSNLMHMNYEQRVSLELPVAIVESAYSGMLLIDEQRGMPGPDFPQFRWYKKNIVVNRYRVPDSYTEVMEYVWDGVREIAWEQKVTIQYLP